MILISHRGNVDGRIESYENNPSYIDLAIERGFQVEIDIWYLDDSLWLGHDNPQYKIDLGWIKNRISILWIHCKNIDAMIYLKNTDMPFNYFWHQEDDVTITSLGYFWTYPGKKLTKNSIAVMPELRSFQNIEISLGVCSDLVINFQSIV
jgi:hypothetical protein